MQVVGACRTEPEERLGLSLLAVQLMRGVLQISYIGQSGILEQDAQGTQLTL